MDTHHSGSNLNGGFHKVHSQLTSFRTLRMVPRLAGPTWGIAPVRHGQHGWRMSLRSWAIRGLILAGVAALAVLAWIARSWVSPERVRAQVIAHLSEQFEGAEVHVGDARMRLFGGIAVSDIRLVRPGSDTPFLIVPSAVLHHDKEQMNRGRMVIKKVELENPEFNLERGPDGKWNVADVLKPTLPDKPVPTFVIKGGTIHITDRGPDPLPPLTLTDAQLTLLNDPLPMLAIQMHANAGSFGPLAVRARLSRVNGMLSVGIEMTQFPVGEVAVAAADRFAPELAPHLTGLSATASVTADLSYNPDSPRQWRHDIRLDFKDANFTHPSVPWTVEKIGASVRIVDGRVKVEDATAEVNGAKVKLSLETRADRSQETGDRRQETTVTSQKSEVRSQKSAETAGLQKLEEYFQRIEVSVAGVPLDDTLYKYLPERASRTRRLFSPSGQVDLGYKFIREPAGWKREIEVRPQQIAVTYEKFKYPVADLRGWVKRTDTPTGVPTTAVDLVGTAGGQLITIKGQLVGDGDDPGMNLRITGANIPMDDTLIAAFPAKYADIVRRFHATGRGDFVAEIVQQQGVNLCENEFRVDVRDATMNHVEFPYPLEKVKGRLVARTTATDSTRPIRPGAPLVPLPDRDEIVLDSFTAVHAGAAVWVNGSKRPIPNSRDRKLTLHVNGNNCPVDNDLKAAFGAIKADSIWTTFNPRGRVTFAADLELIDRAPPLDHPDFDPPINPATDLKLTFNFSGPTVTPSFFPYEMTDFAAWLEYKNGRVDVAHVAGRHGETRVKLAAGEIRLYPDGTVWANLGGLEMKPFVADAALLKALPGQLGAAVEDLKLKGSVELVVKHLVVLDPPSSNRSPLPEPSPNVPMSQTSTPLTVMKVRAQSPGSLSLSSETIIYWDAEIHLAGASLDTGVSWEQVFGAVACRGRYDGNHTGLIRGAIWLDRAVIAKQPVTRLSARVVAAPQQPDPARRGEYLPTELEFTDIAGDLFHGVLGGEARVVLTEPSRFDLWLTVQDVQLDEVAKHYKLGNDADLKGIAQAQLRLYNRPDPKTGRLTIEGNGNVHVPTGRMYNLPVLLDLAKVLKGQAPDKTAFEEAHATFRVQGDRIKVEQVDLIGKAVCLGGSGELDTSGEYVKFDFYTMGSQVLARMINTPVGDLTAFLSKNLFRIRLTRENGELRYKPEAVPMVTEPARAAADRLRARAAKMFGGSGSSGGGK